MSEPTITAGFLTRNRLPDLRRAVNSFIATVGVPFHVLVMFDDDSAGYNAYDPPPGVRKALVTMRHYYARGMNRMYQTMKETFPDMDYFMVSNDDVEFLMPHWGVRTLNEFPNLFPNDQLGLLEIGGLEERCAHYVSRRALFDQHFDGLLAEPCYTMYYSDSELMQRLRTMNKYRVIEQSNAICIHYIVRDSLRYEVERWWHADKAEYERRAKLYGWELIKKPDEGPMNEHT